MPAPLPQPRPCSPLPPRSRATCQRGGSRQSRPPRHSDRTERNRLYTRGMSVRRISGAVLLFVAASALSGGGQHAESLTIRNVGIVSMRRPTIDVGTVVVVNGTIAYAGPPDTAPPPSRGTSVDGSGRFLIPGLIDLHTHVSKTRGSSLALLAAHGITTVRDMGGDHEELL